MTDQTERIGMNEALFREVNERIDQLHDDLGGTKTFEIVCECGSAACTDRFPITNDDYGASLDDVWRCDVKRRDDSSGFAESCYVIYDGSVSGVVRGMRCADVGPGCPAGVSVM